MGVPAHNPELSNQAHNYGKVLRFYYSPYSATLLTDESTDESTGKPVNATPLHQSNPVKVDVAGLVATIQGAVRVSDATVLDCLDVGAARGGKGITCSYDRLVPQGHVFVAVIAQIQGLLARWVWRTYCSRWYYTAISGCIAILYNGDKCTAL